MKPGIIQKIFQDRFGEYAGTRRLSARERRAARGIMTCRTPSQGAHLAVCPQGHYWRVEHNSCKHRSCPLCGLVESERWIQERQHRALVCRYYHVIFTVHHALHPLWRFNRRLFTNLLFHGAWHSLRELLADARWLGAEPGVIAVFQSWGETLQAHVHLHFIVTAGGVTPGGRWRASSPSFLLPTRVLRDKFRGKFLAYLREAFARCTPQGARKKEGRVLTPPSGLSVQACLDLLNKLGRAKWNVRIEQPYDYPDGAIKYLARYIQRGPVSEKRILAYDGETVEISYKRPDEHSTQTFRLPVLQFIARLLQHVPEKGTHCTRAYGLFHHTRRRQLDLARQQVGQAPLERSDGSVDAYTIVAQLFPDWDATRCPVCGSPLVTVRIDYSANAPPEAAAA